MSFLRWVAEVRDRRQAARQLRALPDRMLIDIGIEPDRIEETVRELAASRETRPIRSPRLADFARRVRTPKPRIGEWPYPWPR